MRLNTLEPKQGPTVSRELGEAEFAGAVRLPFQEHCSVPQRWELVPLDEVDRLLDDPEGVLGTTEEQVLRTLNERYPCGIPGGSYFYRLSDWLPTPPPKEHQYHRRRGWDGTAKFDGWLQLDRPYVPAADDPEALIAITQNHGPVLVSTARGDWESQGFVIVPRRWDLYQVNYSPRRVNRRQYNTEKREYNRRVSGEIPDSCTMVLVQAMNPYRHNLPGLDFVKFEEINRDWVGHLRQIVTFWQKLAPGWHPWRECRDYKFAATMRNSWGCVRPYWNGLRLTYAEAVQHGLEYLHGAEAKIAETKAKCQEAKMLLPGWIDSSEWLCRHLRREARAMKIALPKKPQPPKPPKKPKRKKKRKARRRVSRAVPAQPPVEELNHACSETASPCG